MAMPPSVPSSAPQGSGEGDAEIDCELDFGGESIVATGGLKQMLAPQAAPKETRGLLSRLGWGKKTVLDASLGRLSATEQSLFGTTPTSNSSKAMSPKEREKTIADIRKIRPDLGDNSIAAIFEYNATPEACLLAAHNAPTMGAPEQATHGVERAGVADPKETAFVADDELVESNSDGDELSQSALTADEIDGDDDAPTTVVTDPEKA